MAIGLVVEYWEPVREFIDECRRPAAAFPWYKFMGLTGGILVTVGVFGEFWGTYRASRVETELRDNNHKIEASLNDRSAEAELKQKQIEQENINLQTALGKLQRSTGPRYLSREEQDQLVNALPQHAFTRLILVYEQGKKEPDRFADDFEAVFKRLHWTVVRLPSPNTLGGIDPTGKQTLPFPPGITIRVVTPSNPPPAALKLKSALEKLDFLRPVTIGPTTGWAQSWEPSKYVEFVIGEK